MACSLICFQDDKLFAYVSSSPLNDREEIYIAQPLHDTLGESISVSHPISLGQIFTLKSDGTISIKNDSTQNNNIMMQNETNDKFIAGIGLVVNSNSNTLPYRGINAQSFYKPSPLQLALGSKILLAIMPNNSIKINMAVISLKQPYIVIDFSDSQSPGYIAITYSLTKGWESDDSRVTKYPSNQYIESILIKPL